MGWFDYYNLFEKYDGDINAATKAERQWAIDSNPDNPRDALTLAEHKYKESRAQTVLFEPNEEAK